MWQHDQDYPRLHENYSELIVFTLTSVIVNGDKVLETVVTDTSWYARPSLPLPYIETL